MTEPEKYDHQILVRGRGAGKTTLGYKWAFEHAQMYGGPVLFLGTVPASQDSVLKDLAKFEWYPDGVRARVSAGSRRVDFVDGDGKILVTRQTYVNDWSSRGVQASGAVIDGDIGLTAFLELMPGVRLGGNPCIAQLHHEISESMSWVMKVYRHRGWDIFADINVM